MKKILLMLLAVVMCFSLVACKDKNKVEENNDVKNDVVISSGESENDSDIKYEFKTDTIEIDYAGQYTVIYYFENNIAAFCDMIYEFDTEEEAISYENSAGTEGSTTITREGKTVTIRSDYSSQNLPRETIEAMAQTIASK